MKKTAIIILALILFFGAWAGCSNDNDLMGTTDTSKSVSYFLPMDWPTRSDQTEPTTEQSTTSLADVSIGFPGEIVVHTGSQDLDYGYQRHYRYKYYGLPGYIVELVPIEEYQVWCDNELKPYSETEPTEPHIFSFIKKFDISFEEFEREVKESYLFWRNLKSFSNEEDELPNPQLLYTFNLERINDYYSLDPARYASAKQWLEEWLLTNQPYESWSAFQASQR